METVNDIPEWMYRAVIKNEGVWPYTKNHAPMLVTVDHAHFMTKEEFDHCALLISGEPDDKCAPEWANWKAQWPTSGEWLWYSEKPEPIEAAWSSGAYVVDDTPPWVHVDGSGSYGRILGGWRNTLKRINRGPEKMAENNWHERGELPPVGTVCEAYYMHGANTRWRRVEILRHGNRECAVLCPDFDWLGWCNTFRPIRTDRERWADRATSLFGEMTYGTALDAHDALLSGELPTPGGDQ